jgi:hypothetical protein
MSILAAFRSIFILKNVTAPVPTVAVAVKDTLPPTTVPIAASALALSDPQLGSPLASKRTGQGPTSNSHRVLPVAKLNNRMKIRLVNQKRTGSWDVSPFTASLLELNVFPGC